jgi:hypothetical protein
MDDIIEDVAGYSDEVRRRRSHRTTSSQECSTSTKMGPTQKVARGWQLSQGIAPFPIFPILFKTRPGHSDFGLTRLSLRPAAILS